MFSDVKDSKYVNLRWVLASPGPITDSDVELASTCPEGQRCIILGFNTQVAASAEKTAKTRGVSIKNFKVIYELYETVVAALSDELDQEEEMTEKGIAEIKGVFPGKDGKVAGCEVLEGRLAVGLRIQVFRKNKMVGQGTINSLRVFKESVQDVDEGNECGFSLDGFEEFEKGDEARCFEVKLVTPKIVGS